MSANAWTILGTNVKCYSCGKENYLKVDIAKGTRQTHIVVCEDDDKPGCGCRTVVDVEINMKLTTWSLLLEVPDEE